MVGVARYAIACDTPTPKNAPLEHFLNGFSTPIYSKTSRQNDSLFFMVEMRVLNPKNFLTH
jgi:hypothetical protein